MSYLQVSYYAWHYSQAHLWQWQPPRCPTYPMRPLMGPKETHNCLKTITWRVPRYTDSKNFWLCCQNNWNIKSPLATESDANYLVLVGNKYTYFKIENKMLWPGFAIREDGIHWHLQRTIFFHSDFRFRVMAGRVILLCKFLLKQLSR